MEMKTAQEYLEAAESKIAPMIDTMAERIALTAIQAVLEDHKQFELDTLIKLERIINRSNELMKRLQELESDPNSRRF